MAGILQHRRKLSSFCSYQFKADVTKVFICLLLCDSVTHENIVLCCQIEGKGVLVTV